MNLFLSDSIFSHLKGCKLNLNLEEFESGQFKLVIIEGILDLLKFQNFWLAFYPSFICNYCLCQFQMKLSVINY